MTRVVVVVYKRATGSGADLLEAEAKGFLICLPQGLDVDVPRLACAPTTTWPLAPSSSPFSPSPPTRPSPTAPHGADTLLTTPLRPRAHHRTRIHTKRTTPSSALPPFRPNQPPPPFFRCASRPPRTAAAADVHLPPPPPSSSLSPSLSSTPQRLPTFVAVNSTPTRVGRSRSANMPARCRWE